ncbi:uncharacterized protein LOC144449546 [Glandiceps talaboti]
MPSVCSYAKTCFFLIAMTTIPTTVGAQGCEATSATCGHGCLNGGTCQSYGEDASCECPNGFTGQYCDTVIPEECTDDVDCLNGGNCTTDAGGNYCYCPSGYTGYECETNVLCSGSNLCLNGGTCDGSNNCVCPEGVTGSLCETIYAECGCNEDISCPSADSCPCCTVGETCEADDPENPSDDTSPTGTESDGTSKLGPGFSIILLVTMAMVFH